MPEADQEFQTVAEAFCVFAKLYVRGRPLLPADMALTMRVLRIAGFKPGALSLEQMHVQMFFDVEQGIPPRCINETFGYKVVNERGEDDRNATGWLNAFYEQVDAWVKIYVPNFAVSKAVDEIIRSVPLQPILLNGHGECLCELFPTYTSSPESGINFLVDHTTDDSALPAVGSTCGIHDMCCGVISRVQVTERLDVLCCGKCNLRVPFSHSVNTYGDLRRHIANFGD